MMRKVASLDAGPEQPHCPADRRVSLVVVLSQQGWEMALCSRSVPLSFPSHLLKVEPLT